MVEKTRISVRFDIAQTLREAAGLLSSHPAKRLRRMPHLFDRQLELPVDADSFVQVQEDPSAFTFKVTLPPPLPELHSVHAEIVHIIPGVTKVCVAGAQIVLAHLEELDVPLWRFRLPPSSLPEAATASCDDHGLLVLTVPKSSTFQEVSPGVQHTDEVLSRSASFISGDPGPTVRVEGPVQESADIICATQHEPDRLILSSDSEILEKET